MICIEQCVFPPEPRRMCYNVKILVNANCQFNYNDNTMSPPNSLLKGLVHDHVIYVFIYLLTASNLFNFIYLKF